MTHPIYTDELSAFLDITKAVLRDNLIDVADRDTREALKKFRTEIFADIGQLVPFQTQLTKARFSRCT